MTTQESSRPTTVVLAGASGLIGRPLVHHLRRRGVHVRLLVRRSASNADEIAWNPADGRLDPRTLDGVHAVVNLGGANLGSRRWTASFKAEILRSRLQGTSLLATTAARCERPPTRFLQASAIGFYGDRGDEVLDESSPGGEGFLADVVRRWEAATEPAREAGVGVVSLRSGLVLTTTGGAAGRLLPLFRLGVGGRLGSGRQWWSWISLVDETRAILHLLDSTLTGPVNLTAEPARNSAVTRALGEALHRPTVLPVPAFALRAVLGEFAGDVLGSIRVLPSALRADGFVHHHPGIREAAAWLARPSTPGP